jgi:outer membrane murein-binding lipoprotein Lpp
MAESGAVRVIAAVAGGLFLAGGAAAQPPTERGRERVLELAHQVTVAAAIDALPKPLKAFYKDHRAEMPSLALEPEFPVRGPERRFMVDRLLPFPFRELPRSEAEIKARYGEKAEGVGRLPWLVQESYARLVDAMKAGDKEKILAESDVLGGLVVDVHSPLNLTENYDGQKTGQHGLWVRFVEKLPQALGRDLKVSPDAANYLDNPKEYVFSMMLGSYVWLDNTLYLEELARRGKSGYGDPYFEDLARKVGPILRERLARAAEDAGSYWYTAWTVAGRPDLK